VTDQELLRARSDAAFRQRLLAVSLEWLLPEAARQMREGVALAVQLADRLQTGIPGDGPKAA
jgi:hypothetical protein